MDNNFCPECGTKLTFVGTQRIPVTGIEYDMRHCENEVCSRWKLTRSYNVRPIDPAHKGDLETIRAIIKNRNEHGLLR